MLLITVIHSIDSHGLLYYITNFNKKLTLLTLSLNIKQDIYFLIIIVYCIYIIFLMKISKQRIYIFSINNKPYHCFCDLSGQARVNIQVLPLHHTIARFHMSF